MPVFVVAVLGMVDVGFMLFEKMALDQMLRSAAQLAIEDPAEAGLYEAVRLTAAPELAVAASEATPQTGEVALSVRRYGVCAEAPDTEVAINATCAGGQPTSILYRLEASKGYTGYLLPQMDVGAQVVVQIR
ncbi:pilus assembly protein [Jiella sp. LLJ827]|nr:pilus assembly protein [Jiella sp. LLJ827]